MNDTYWDQIYQHKTPDISYSHKLVIVIARFVSH